MNTRYTFHTDPGHGWIEVSSAELRALGIADQISEYSYQSRDGSVAYLEEDCDFSTFARAKGWNPCAAPQFKELHHDCDSFIRYLPRFRMGARRAANHRTATFAAGAL